MSFIKRISRLFKKPGLQDLERAGEWETLLEGLAESQRVPEMEAFAKAIARVGNREAVPGLVKLMLQSYQNGHEVEEEMKKASWDPQALLMERLRGQTNISTIGYDSQSVRSPIQELREVMSLHFMRGHAALHALIGLRAADEIRTVLNNPAHEKSHHNFRSALNQIEEARENSGPSRTESGA